MRGSRYHDDGFSACEVGKVGGDPCLTTRPGHGLLTQPRRDCTTLRATGCNFDHSPDSIQKICPSLVVGLPSDVDGICCIFRSPALQLACSGQSQRLHPRPSSTYGYASHKPRSRYRSRRYDTVPTVQSKPFSEDFQSFTSLSRVPLATVLSFNALPAEKLRLAARFFCKGSPLRSDERKLRALDSADG